MKKTIILLIGVILMSALFFGCASEEKRTETAVQSAETDAEQTEDEEEVTSDEPVSEETSTKFHGLNYDVGIVFDSYMSNTYKGAEVTKRELEIMRDDLHVDTVRLSGTDIDDMIEASEIAFSLGLDVWLSPHYIDYDADELMEISVECARRFEELCKKYPERDNVFVVGCELTWFMNGFIEGETFEDRINGPQFTAAILNPDTYEAVNDFLEEYTTELRKVYSGKLTYASTEYEQIDWNLFDIISLDYYRLSYNRLAYGSIFDINGYYNYGKPVVVSEVGLCCYTGAEDKGGSGYQIRSEEDRTVLTGEYERNEKLQAEELTDLMTILYDTDVDGVFWFTFEHSEYTHVDNDPIHDLDIAAYGLVTVWADGRYGTTYPDMQWEPKEAFYALQDFYATH